MLPSESADPHAARESIELVVRYQRMNTFFADYVKNISRGGTFIATQEPLPIDTEFELVLGVPDLDEPLALRARVMWTTPPEAASSEHPAGMGIRFMFRDADEQGRIEGVIENLLVDHLGQRHTDRLLRR